MQVSILQIDVMFTFCYVSLFLSFLLYLSPFMTQSAVSASGHVQTGAKSVLVKKGRIVTVTQRFVAQSFNVGRRLVDVQEPVMAGVRYKERAVEGWGGGRACPRRICAGPVGILTDVRPDTFAFSPLE